MINLAYLAFLIIKKPIKVKKILITVIINEFLVLIVILCSLTLAILDKS